MRLRKRLIPSLHARASKASNAVRHLLAHDEGRSTWGLFARKKVRCKKSSLWCEKHIYSLNGSVSLAFAVPDADEPAPCDPDRADGPHTAPKSTKRPRSTLELRMSPAEESLARYVLEHCEEAVPKGSRVLELGAGHFGFVGLAVASASEAVHVEVTDNAPSAVEDLQRHVEMNRACWDGRCEVVSRLLSWEHCAALEASSFELIVGADIVYRQTTHQALLSCVDHLLTPQGLAVLCASIRNRALDAFLEAARAKFNVAVHDWEDQEGHLQNAGMYRGIERPPVLVVNLRRMPECSADDLPHPPKVKRSAKLDVKVDSNHEEQYSPIWLRSLPSPGHKLREKKHQEQLQESMHLESMRMPEISAFTQAETPVMALMGGRVHVMGGRVHVDAQSPGETHLPPPKDFQVVALQSRQKFEMRNHLQDEESLVRAIKKQNSSIWECNVCGCLNHPQREHCFHCHGDEILNPPLPKIEHKGPLRWLKSSPSGFFAV